MRNVFSPKSARVRATRPGFRIANEGKTDEATVYVYDAIDAYWGINAQEFVRQIAALDVATIHVRINSPGGVVFDAMAMATALRAHSAHVVSHIDGLAASSASFLALAADEVRMSDGAFFMIHEAWTFAYGSARDFRKTADTLDKIGESIINEYLKKTKLDREQIVDWMEEETWFSASDALEHGFVDAVDGAESDVSNSFDLSIFQNVPAALLAPAEQHDRSTNSERATRDAGHSIREQEKALRDAGFTRSDAKRAALALSKPVLGQRDADENAESDNDAIDRLLASLHSHPPITHGTGRKGQD